MTVKKAIEELQKQNPNAQLVLAVDPEGNGFSPMDVVEGNAVFADGELYYPEDEGCPKGKKKVVVLWPR